MNSVRRLVVSAVATAALALPFALGSPLAGLAYGNQALWQVGAAANCDNPAVCGTTNLGGFWGWIEFDADGTGDAEAAGCSHMFASGPALGADHVSLNITGWTTGPALLPFDVPGVTTDFYLLSGTATMTYRGTTITIPIEGSPLAGDSGIPAAAGHYSSQQLFGSAAVPGVNFTFQVSQLAH